MLFLYQPFPHQTDAALFFADNAVQYWNRTLRTLAGQYLTDSGDIARMFALVNVAMADALITAWHAKEHFNFWRPITAIRLGDTDGNSKTAGDPAWTPYIVTPNYPEYTSGANNLSGSATTMLANFFGSDKVSFTMTSTFVHPSGATPVNPRTYSRFSDARTISSTRAFTRAFTSGLATKTGGVRESTWLTGRITTSCVRCTEGDQPSSRFARSVS